MSTEQLFKEFLKFYNTMNPAGMGATGAKKLRDLQDEREAVEYQTGAEVDPSPEGDSFSDIVEKRASAPEPPDAFPARVRDGMDIMRQDSRAREEAALAGDGPAPEPPDAFAARVRDGMDIMRQKSRARDRTDKAISIPASIEYMTDRLSKAAKAAARGGAAAGRRAAGGDMLVEGVPSETPTVEEMNSRNEEFGDSFDFMEGSEEYPAGRDKKSDRKAQRKAKRKSKRKDKEPLIATEAGRTIDEIAAPELQVDVSKAAKAEVISEDPEDYTDKAIELFQNTHGTSFDPKSRTDRGKLENMKSLLAAMGGMGNMTPNQFALQFYREYP